MLHGCLAHPVDLRVVTDGGVRCVNHDHLVELVSGILAHPIRVEDAKSRDGTTSALFSNSLKGSLILELVDTLVLRLTRRVALGDWTLATTAANANAVDDKALLGLVTKTASLLRSAGLRATVDSWLLTVLPAADTQQKAQGIALLLAVNFLNVLVSAHDT